MDEIFESATRSTGDLAGVFEHDGETCYFYLYATGGNVGKKVLDAIHVASGELDFAEADIIVRWAANEQRVGLLIKGVLWAVFDCGHRTKHGGSYRLGGKPSLPPGIEVGF